MSFRKNVVKAVGPFLTALVIFAILFLAPFHFGKLSDKKLTEAATSMSLEILKGDTIKNQAVGNIHYLPFFGSSELTRMDSFHPSVLANKYHRPYQPFLLGSAGTQSLTHFLSLQSMGGAAEGKKIVFILSPQWFVSNGVSRGMFAHYYSPLQVYQWLSQTEKPDDSSKYCAKRLLQLSFSQEEESTKKMLVRIAAGEPLTKRQKFICQIQINFLSREDDFFSRFNLISRKDKVETEEKKLPATYDLSRLERVADQQGEKASSDNDFDINNHFYNEKIHRRLKELAGSQQTFDYRSSPEFSDFQLVLDEIAKKKMDVLFVIPPVNERWSNYTGLSAPMLAEFSAKIKQQLTSQGFNNVVDFSDKGKEKYFMEDTIHLGWRGWLALDQNVQIFLEHENVPRYRIDPYYYSKEWQQKKNG